MGLFGKKKNGPPTGNDAYEQGYVSFTAEDLKKQAAESHSNSEAYDFLDQAMFTSSHVKERDKKRGTVNIDDVYPITLEEALEMERLLDQADAALKDPSDSFYRERSGELRGIVEWSKKRHWTFSWMLILCTFVCLCCVMQCSSGAKADLKRAERQLAKIEGWAEQDTTLDISAQHASAYTMMEKRFSSPQSYKAYHLVDLAEQYGYNQKYAEEAQAKADTASTDERRKEYLAQVEENKQKAEEYKQKFDELNAKKFEDIQEMAIEEQESTVGEMSGNNIMMGIILFFFIILIPLYIIAEHPYGYTISRHRTEAKVLGGLRKFSYWLAGGIIGAGVLGNFIFQDTKYVNVHGREVTPAFNNNAGMAMGRFAFKTACALAALAVVCATAGLIVIYSTIVGLSRNYDWKAIIADLKAKQAARKAA